MKNYLIPKEGNFYKANLHAHTVVSDGEFTPEETKRVYREKGYSVFAFTDHDVFITHNELTDKDFVALNGFEIEINEAGKPWPDTKTTHLCFIALDDRITVPVNLRPDYACVGNASKYRETANFGDTAESQREYSPECINHFIKKGRENGFFVSYNHPRWSLQDYTDYSRYEGMNALEIFNGGCIVEAYDDVDGHEYDDMLRLGKRIAVTGSDDNHDHHPLGHPLNDSFIGWTMIKAEKLDYKSIAKALENGDYYASMGPEIYDMYYDTDDGAVHVSCSGARFVGFTTGRRNTRAVRDPDGKLNEASFPFCKDDRYVRVTVTDKDGNTAQTRAYFFDEI